MKSFTPVDQKYRDLAINNCEQNLSIEAGAGTGKTTLLSERYVKTLLDKEVPLHSCVAITFTEKAALELKQRIKQLLIDKDKLQLAKDVHQAPISTIHSFCASILREKPFSAGLDPDFSQLDPLQQQHFLNTCFDLFLNESLIESSHDLPFDHPNNVFHRLNAYDINIIKIKELCLQAYYQRDYFKKSAQQKVVWPDLKKFIYSMQQSFDKLAQFAQIDCLDQTDLAFVYLKKTKVWLDYLYEQDFSEHLLALLYQFSFPNRGQQKNWKKPETLKYIKETLAHLKQQHSDFCLQLGQCIANDTLYFLKAFVEFVAAQKKNQSVLDFDDLLIETEKLLKLDPIVRKHFQSHFRYFFIDEFQDTDPIQKNIIWLLAKLEDDKSDKTSFIVGDPKQSIYRFRGASLETYAQATLDFKKRDQHVPIVQNFRSSAPVIDWINALFSQLLSQDYHALEALKYDPPAQTGVFALQAHQNQNLETAQALRDSEAQSISLYIQNLLREQQPLVFDKSTQTYRAAQAKDIAILYPTSTGLEQLEESLRQHQIPFLSQSGKSFFKRTEIAALIHILHYLAKPDSGIALCATLKSCYFGLSDDDIYILNAYVSLDKLNLNDSNLEKEMPAHIFNALTVLANIQKLKHHNTANTNLSLSELISSIVETLHVFPNLNLRKHKLQATANVKKFMALSMYYQQNISHSMYDFTNWCLSMQQGKFEQSEATLHNQDINAVQLMTMHKSKGLEFPIVILCQLSSANLQYDTFLKHPHKGQYGFGFSFKGKTFHTDTYRKMIAEEDRALLEEKKRLLYVACTRAKDQLIISQFRPKRLSKKSYLFLLDQAWKQAESLCENISFDPETLTDYVIDTAPLEKISQSRTDHKFSEYQSFAQHISQRKAILENAFPMKQTVEEKHSHAILASLDKSTFGTLFHKLMQDMGEYRFDRTFLPQAVQHQSLDTELISQLTTCADLCLQTDIMKNAGQADIICAEYPVLQFQQDTAKMQESYVDLLFKHNNKWILVDYKTDDIKQEHVQQQAQTHEEQIQSYVELLKTQHNIIIDEAYVMFVRLGIAHKVLKN